MSDELETLFPTDALLVTEFPVDGKILHEWLGVKTKFHIWVMRRIVTLELVQGLDYELIKNDRNEIKHFKVSLPIAKELGMIEKTDRGRKVRRYFLECERAVFERIPLLKKQLSITHDEIARKEQLLLQLQSKRKPKDTIRYCWVKVVQPALENFEPIVEWKRVPRTDLTEEQKEEADLGHTLNTMRGLAESILPIDEKKLNALFTLVKEIMLLTGKSKK